MQRPNFVIEPRIPIAATIVILDHVLDRRDAAVVHIRRSAPDLAQRRRLEIAATRARIGESSIAPSDPGVCEASHP